VVCDEFDCGDPIVRDDPSESVRDDIGLAERPIVCDDVGLAERPIVCDDVGLAERPIVCDDACEC
jgi:hypothetical protein